MNEEELVNICSSVDDRFSHNPNFNQTHYYKKQSP